ncbi:MAG: carbohydrate ABC transporter permease [Ruminococcaceae bacterium]|nr:carbohydrate ABC transporter permease [Oscillospiraceae bacterium]
MNAQDTQPKVMRESKNKIRVDFERTPLLERLKAKFLSVYFLKNVVWYIFRLILLIGIAYVVLFPFLTKIASSFMAPEDFIDVTVRLIPKNFTLDTYKAVLSELGYWKSFVNTFTLSLSCALIQMFICSLIGYGFAKFRFKGNGILFLLVMLTMIVPHQTLQLSMFMTFRYFDIFGIFQFLAGGGITLFGETFLEGVIDIIPEKTKLAEIWTPYGLNLCNTYAPLIIMSITGLAFKNGLYIYMLRQFFTGVPDALEESAYLDGAGTMRTFFQIILPLSVPMMITVFLFAFCWQWTDDFYTTMFFTSTKTELLVKIVGIPSSLKIDYSGQNLYYAAIRNTCGLVIILPLVILYLFCQNFLVQGIERSGLTAD